MAINFNYFDEKLILELKEQCSLINCNLDNIIEITDNEKFIIFHVIHKGLHENLVWIKESKKWEIYECCFNVKFNLGKSIYSTYCIFK